MEHNRLLARLFSTLHDFKSENNLSHRWREKSHCPLLQCLRISVRRRCKASTLKKKKDHPATLYFLALAKKHPAGSIQTIVVLIRLDRLQFCTSITLLNLNRKSFEHVSFALKRLQNHIYVLSCLCDTQCKFESFKDASQKKCIDIL